jgi:hypothetical protein
MVDCAVKGGGLGAKVAEKVVRVLEVRDELRKSLLGVGDIQRD